MRVSINRGDWSRVIDRWRAGIHVAAAAAAVLVAAGSLTVVVSPVARADDIKYEAFYTPCGSASGRESR